MKKKIFSLVLCLIMCMSVLTGCNLFGTDIEGYYNAVVATINYDYTLNGQQYTYSEDITKRELIDAYNSYGYNYSQNYGYSMEDAIDMTLDNLINTKLMLTDVKNHFGDDLFDDAETTYLWRETYYSFYENLQSYYNDLMGIDDEEDSTDSDEEEPVVYEKYKPNAVLYDKGNQKYGVKRVTAVETVRGSDDILYYDLGDEQQIAYDYEKEVDGVYVFKEMIHDTISNLTLDTNWEEAFDQYMSAVRENYSYEDLKGEEKCFYFELDRIYEIVRDNYLVQRYEELYNRYAESGSTLTNVRAEDIVNYYNNEVRADYDKYSNDSETFETDVLSNSTLVDYVYEGTNATNYFNVGVIKIDFKDKTLEDLDEIKNNGDYAEYLDAVENLYNSMYVSVKDETTGEVIIDEKTGKEVTVTASELLKLINDEMVKTKDYLDLDTILADENEVNGILELKGYETSISQEQKEQIVRSYVEDYNRLVAYEKADAFVKYYYYYNDDTTFLNTDKNAVFGIARDGSVVYSSQYSESQNDAFDAALKELYNNGNAQVGDTSGIIRTDDGIYILFYAGAVENLYPGVTKDFALTVSDITTLAKVRVNIFSEKKIFDYIYDELYEEDQFSNFEEANLNYLVHALTKADENAIIKNYDNYKDLIG